MILFTLVKRTEKNVNNGFLIYTKKKVDLSCYFDDKFIILVINFESKGTQFFIYSCK